MVKIIIRKTFPYKVYVNNYYAGVIKTCHTCTGEEMWCFYHKGNGYPWCDDLSDMMEMLKVFITENQEIFIK